jgi:hypothetical protein
MTMFKTGRSTSQHGRVHRAAVRCGEDGSIEDALADGELRRRYADLWAGYLTETGCTYDAIGC